MGIFDWMSKSNSGSLISTAKVIAEFYKALPKQEYYPKYADSYYGFDEIIEFRKHKEKQLGMSSLLSNYDTEMLIKKSCGNMELLIFQIMYLESDQFRKSVTSEETIETTIRKIKSVVDEILPERKLIEGYSKGLYSKLPSVLRFVFDNKTN